MDDFPRTVAEFEARFATEEACRAYLGQLRWPDGFRCRCGETNAWWTARGLWQCTACGAQTSVTAGTVFQDTRKPLRLWLHAMWWVASQKTGGSALGLQRLLGLGSYETAWTWLHKLRRAMVRPGRDRLAGHVEVDETYLGGLSAPRGRSTAKKALVVVAVELVGPRLGRIRLRRIKDASADRLQAFIDEAIEPGSLLHTDGWAGYHPVGRHGYRHQVTILRGQQAAPSRLLPHVHRVVSLLRRWLLGTHQGAVTPAHLDYYLDEFTFRFNRRTSRHAGQLFFRLAQQAVAVVPAPYTSLVKHVRRDRKR
jgi:transposase-like protein/ribosomal protein L37AE/L43A